MRIISGKWKGRRFFLPKGVSTRPTSDMLREALFSILRNEIENANVLDLFAGSASFAFEAISRGANHAVICDNSRKCIAEIESNLEKFGAEKNCYTLINSDFKQAIIKTGGLGIGIDICYIDPPYKSSFYIEALEFVDNVINADGIVITEHDRRESMPDRIGGLSKQREKKYGNTVISIYRKEIS